MLCVYLGCKQDKLKSGTLEILYVCLICHSIFSPSSGRFVLVGPVESTGSHLFRLAKWRKKPITLPFSVLNFPPSPFSPKPNTPLVFNRILKKIDQVGAVRKIPCRTFRRKIQVTRPIRQMEHSVQINGHIITPRKYNMAQCTNGPNQEVLHSQMVITHLVTKYTLQQLQYCKGVPLLSLIFSCYYYLTH